jgi:NADH-quinone oxidoreductase subunit M
MYFLIGIWGGPRKEYAAIKFFLYTLFGSVIMLLGILALYFTSTPNTFDILELSKNQPFTPLFQILVYLSLFIGFAVKVPIFPFHTWLPDAHVEAPTAVSVILAGVLLKMGTYGILRVSYTVLPLAAKQFIPILAFLALINIVYGAFVAMAQKDLKKMIAYSSINHMGYVLLGMIAILGDKAAEGLNGAVFQMFNHGIITGMLFLLVGVLYDRAHTRDIDSFGGLKNKMPVYSGLMITACMASLGLPGLAGFISEFMCFIGGFAANKLVTIISALGIVVTAAYFLIMIQKVFLGGPNEKWKDLKDIDARELIAVVPLMALTVLLGIFPQFAIDLSDATIRVLVDTLAKVKL